VKRLWVGAALYGAVLTLFSLIAAARGGAAWGWALLAAGLLLALLRHLNNLANLYRWANQPIGTPVPYGSGAWGWVFAALSRRARAAQGQRQELSVALERLLDAAHAMLDGVIILNRLNAIEWLNAAAERQFGLKSRDDIGVPITNLVRQPAFVAYLDSGVYAEPLVIHAAWDGGRAYSVQVIPFGDAQKLIVSRDVTHLDRLERMRRDFVANVSHELKTPLTVVLGFVETLVDHLHDLSPEEADRYLALTEEQTKRMQRLVDDLLTLSELETGTPLPFDDEVAVQAVTADVARDAEALSAGRHQIVVDPGQPALLLGSARELRSAFTNLASNAVRYTPPGGTVSMVWSMETDGSGRFSVRDTGIGIEAHHIPRLTERFYRVDRGRSRESGGTGLGLAIVKHILTRHQANLEITSEPGRGSCFTVKLPARRVRPLSEASPVGSS
jgi:two-component system phosphate regulon sensor histidine kinase PhoR